MHDSRQKTLASKKERAVSTSSHISNLSVASSSLSEFFESKVQACEADVDYLKCYQEGLNEALQTKKMEESHYQTEMTKLDREYEPLVKELHLLKKQRRYLEEEVDDEYQSACKRLKPNESAQDIGLIERAYASALVSKVMWTTGEQKKNKFDQTKFRSDVMTYYNAARNSHDDTDLGYCHISDCWYLAEDIEAAHLVPKSLHGDELAFLFGVREILLADPRNGKYKYL